MSREEKIRKLKELGSVRKSDFRIGYSNIASFKGGLYESEFVSPYTKGSQNVESGIFVLLQDWVSKETLEGKIDQDLVEKGRSSRFSTNSTLEKYLGEFFGLSLEDVFSTNLFPLIKMGGASAEIGEEDYEWAARKYALPQIEIVQPKIVVLCGKKVYQAVFPLIGSGAECGEKMAEIIPNPITWKGIRFFTQAHPGSLGQRNRGRELAREDWRKMAEYFRK